MVMVYTFHIANTFISFISAEQVTSIWYLTWRKTIWPALTWIYKRPDLIWILIIWRDLTFVEEKHRQKFISGQIEGHIYKNYQNLTSIFQIMFFLDLTLDPNLTCFGFHYRSTAYLIKFYLDFYTNETTISVWGAGQEIQLSISNTVCLYLCSVCLTESVKIQTDTTLWDGWLSVTYEPSTRWVDALLEPEYSNRINNSFRRDRTTHLTFLRECWHTSNKQIKDLSETFC